MGPLLEEVVWREATVRELAEEIRAQIDQPPEAEERVSRLAITPNSSSAVDIAVTHAAT